MTNKKSGVWSVSKEFHFSAAHSLPHLPVEHKCHHLHGHNYILRIHCSGDLIPGMGWVVDYADIKNEVQPFVDLIDHKNLDDVIKTQTTAENVAFWFYKHLKGSLPVTRVDVHETVGTCCSYEPGDEK